MNNLEWKKSAPAASNNKDHVKGTSTTNTLINELYDSTKMSANIEELCEFDIEKRDELEEEKYYMLLSIAYGLIAILADAPYFIIVSMSDYFRHAFNVTDIMINEFALMESIILIVVCIFLHLIGSYRLRWNVYQPLLTMFSLGIIHLIVHFKSDYIGHKIVIFSAVPFGIISCVIKMTTIKICVLFRKQYCSAYVCGLSMSGFLVFVLYVLGAYVFFENDINKFCKMFSLFYGVISFLSIICFMILYKIYSLPFVKRLGEKFEDKGFLINKEILFDSFKSMSVVWEYMLIAFLANIFSYQIYPTVFPACIDENKEMKGLLSGVLLFGDSLAHLLVHIFSNFFIKINFVIYTIIKIFRLFFLPIFVILVLYKNSFLNSQYFLIPLAYTFGFTHGILSNSVFLKIPEACRKKNKEQYLKLAPNIVFLSFIFGTMIGVFISKIYVRILVPS
ncbi:nucleoside transporter 3, putative [Plasmodium malariae]|uniref:Nucleoside transporter 3, putative n=1 Tax=Plasmodium malariae TaxID=5858 RepID=A0A1D3SQS1_PLAMA|nr:nucleoside transporter 3, putative [Plasmodium malariae]SCO93878.1 nucleoside transporter 3, putative [Plasmodium malariae]